MELVQGASTDGVMCTIPPHAVVRAGQSMYGGDIEVTSEAPIRSLADMHSPCKIIKYVPFEQYHTTPTELAILMFICPCIFR